MLRASIKNEKKRIPRVKALEKVVEEVRRGNPKTTGISTEAKRILTSSLTSASNQKSKYDSIKYVNSTAPLKSTNLTASN